MSSTKHRRLGIDNARTTKATATDTCAKAAPTVAARPAKGAGAVPRTKKERPTRTRIFVYGTLLRGERNHRWIARSTFDGEARTKPAFTLYDLGAYPALVAGGQHTVAGEVYEVDEGTLAELDRLEGHPRFYQRTPIRLADDSLVLTYLLQPAQVEGSSLIVSGRWRMRHTERALSST
jgi:gamma-glutamylaminecyclotransferase